MVCFYKYRILKPLESNHIENYVFDLYILPKILKWKFMSLRINEGPPVSPKF